MKAAPLTTPAQLASAAGWTALYTLRATERALGPAGMRIAALPAARLLAARDSRRLDRFRPGPAACERLFHPRPFSVTAWRDARARFHLTRMLCALPDRLALPPWRERGRMAGGPHLLAARDAGRPVVMATLHFGGMLLLRYWLRALGQPAATLVRETVVERSALKQHKDALSSSADGPAVFSGRAPRAALRFLRGGGLLTVMLDHTEGRLLDAPIPGGRWRISSTALRLAAAANAVLLPVLVSEPAPWQFVIHLGRPVPEGCLADARQFPAAAGHLWNEFLPVLRAAPHDAMSELFNSLRSETNEV